MSRISEKVRAAKDVTQKELVPVGDWDTTVEVRGMTVGDRASYFAHIAEIQREGNFTKDEDMQAVDAHVVINCVFDPDDGNHAFTEDDVDMLVNQPAAIVGTLASIALRLSGLDGKAEERLGKGCSTSAKTALKVMESSSTDGSSSDLPVN
jgi:hypothetical protein